MNDHSASNTSTSGFPKLDPQLKAISAAIVSAMSWDDGDICPERPWRYLGPGPGFGPDPDPRPYGRGGSRFEPEPSPAVRFFPGAWLSLVGEFEPFAWRRGIRLASLDWAMTQPVAWTSKLSMVALNPQPLPPGSLGGIFGGALVSALISDEDAPSEAGGLFGVRLLGEFVDACGTLTRWELLRWWLEKFRRKRWPIPIPVPGPNWQEKLNSTELLTLGSVLVQGSLLAPAKSADALATAGQNLLKSGLSRA